MQSLMVQFILISVLMLPSVSAHARNLFVLSSVTATAHQVLESVLQFLILAGRKALTPDISVVRMQSR